MTDISDNALADDNVERAVIAAVVIDLEQRERALTKLTPEDFYSGVNCVIFTACLALWKVGSEIDALMIASEIKKTNTGTQDDWFQVVVNILSDAALPRSIDDAMIVLKDYTQRRKMISVLSTAASRVYSLTTPTDSIVTDIANRLEVNVSGDGIVTASASAKAVLERIESAASGASPYIPTGFKALDVLMSGVLKNELIIVGARPGMGKTSFMVSMLNNLVSAGVPVAMASLEQSHDELTAKLLAMRIGFQIGEINKGAKYENGAFRPFNDAEWDTIVKGLGEIDQLPFYYIEREHVRSVADLRAATRQLSIKNGVRLLFLDYLQLMTSDKGDDGNRAAMLSAITRDLKIAAMDLGVPIIAGSQINRGVESRDNKRPMLSDLRESGSIEQDADLVMFLYRDEVYDPNTEYINIAEVDVSKNRRGPTGKTEMFFDKLTTRFGDLVKQRIEL